MKLGLDIIDGVTEEERVRRLYETEKKHSGPGNHPSGSDQDVHGKRRRGHERSSQRPDQEGKLLDATRASGGFTYNPRGKNLVRRGFSVSAFKEREEILTAKEWNDRGRAIIKGYIAKNKDLLSRRNHHFGGWHDTDNGVYVLDVVLVVNEEAVAKRLAKDHDQDAYYDLIKGETIFVKPMEARVKMAQERWIRAIAQSHEMDDDEIEGFMAALEDPGDTQARKMADEVAGCQISLKAADPDLQVVWGEVYAPDRLDSHGDIMGQETIRKIAWQFLSSGLVAKVDRQHNNQEQGAVVVESFIAREADEMFIPGSWVVGVHVPDEDTWADIKRGRINGFSMEALVRRKHIEVEVEVPRQLRGATDTAEGHTHPYTVRFSAEGDFLGGVAERGDAGHSHRITKATMTEELDGHAHRFSILDKIQVRRMEQ